MNNEEERVIKKIINKEYKELRRFCVENDIELDWELKQGNAFELRAQHNADGRTVYPNREKIVKKVLTYLLEGGLNDE